MMRIKYLKHITIIIIGLAILMEFSACQTPAEKSPGNSVDDYSITTKAKARLLADENLRGIAVAVKTFEGEVTLTGAAGTAAQKKRAEEIVKTVNGVKSVNNLLKVK